MKSSLAILLAFVLHLNVFSQLQKIPVFTSGKEGYKSYRIPALLKLPGGDLLAFCEGRVNNAGDYGNVDIVLKRSKDEGETWSSLDVVVNNDTLQAGNPAPVIDMKDPAYPKGRIFLFYNTGNNSEGEIRKGRGLREVWYITSTDNGVSWSTPVNITTQVHRPKQPQFNAAYNFTEDWRSYANTPGHAMQFAKGKYEGRIFVAANHSAGEPQPHFADYHAHGYYTDDHGKTFHLSQQVDIAGSNESTAAELSNNKLMMNSRNQHGDIKQRIVSISNNGGSTWNTVYFDKNLPDPVCQGSLLNIGVKNGRNMLAFSNAADSLYRNNLTLRISLDEGKTWKHHYLIERADDAMLKDAAAYSDIALIHKRSIGILYERNRYAEIVFTVVDWKK